MKAKRKSKEKCSYLARAELYNIAIQFLWGRFLLCSQTSLKFTGILPQSPKGKAPSSPFPSIIRPWSMLTIYLYVYITSIYYLYNCIIMGFIITFSYVLGLFVCVLFVCLCGICFHLLLVFLWRCSISVYCVCVSWEWTQGLECDRQKFYYWTLFPWFLIFKKALLYFFL